MQDSICMSVTLSQFILLYSPLSLCAHPSVLCICVSSPALEPGSSVPLFQIPHRHIHLREDLFIPFHRGRNEASENGNIQPSVTKLERDQVGCQIHLLSRLRSLLVAQQYRICLPMQEMQVRSLGWEDPWRRKWQPKGNLMDGGAWGATVHGVTKSWTQRSN